MVGPVRLFGNFKFALKAGRLTFHQRYLLVGQTCARCGDITFKSAFDELQQKRFGRRGTALNSVFADGHHLPEHGLIGCFLPSAARTTA